MCETLSTDSRLSLIQKARETADTVLTHYLHIPLNKALDPSTPKGFDRAVAELAVLLRANVQKTDVEVVRAALEVLDVDWHATTAIERRGLIAEALRASGRKAAEIPAKIEMVFGDAAEEVVRATRTTARRTHRLSIGADFNAVDKRIVTHLKNSQRFFVLGEYGRRHEMFGREARRIVAGGLESGLGRDDIARDLEKAAQKVLAEKGSFYWDVVAGAFIGQGRSFSLLSSFAEAGIERYVIEAVLDEATTETCRFLHGKTFSVDGGLRHFQTLEANPESLKELNPWVRTGRDDDGQPILYVNKSENRIPIATIERSAAGTRDDLGAFKNALSERELNELGVSFPPFHGLCRSSCLPVLS